MAYVGAVFSEGRILCAGGTGRMAMEPLAEALATLPDRAPLTVLVHGYRFHPGQAANDPQRSIYSLDHGWPRGLGFVAGRPSSGLCVGFGWPAATPGSRKFFGLSGFAEAWHRAEAAGHALAELLDGLSLAAPHRRIDVFAHSLGARVALRAVRAARQARMGRVLLLGAAEFADAAEAALAARAADGAEFYNVTARENAAFDLMFGLIAPCGRRVPTLGQRAVASGSRWVELGLDDAALHRLLVARGLWLERGSWVSHWGFTRRPGALDLYRAILRGGAEWSPAMLATALDEGAGVTVPAPGMAALAT
jgi:hypothetical protein